MLIGQNVCQCLYPPQGTKPEDSYVEKTSTSIAKPTSEFKRTMPKDGHFICAATGVCTFHSMRHDFSFRPSDCSYKLVFPIFVPGFLLHV